MHVARKLAAELEEGVVVCVLADGGWKYLSAGFWHGDDDRAMDEALVVIPPEVREALAAHAHAELPNEACGLLLLRDGVAERYEPGRNTLASPYRFEIEVDPEMWFLEDEGYKLAVFHSHPSTEPKPSRTDVENIGLWAGAPVPDLLGRARRARGVDGSSTARSNRSSSADAPRGACG